MNEKELERKVSEFVNQVKLDKIQGKISENEVNRRVNDFTYEMKKYLKKELNKF